MSEFVESVERKYKMNRLREKYQNQIKKQLKDEFSIENVMSIPRLVKISINAGIGSTLKNKEAREALERDFSIIAGQKVVSRKAKTSIAAFSIRTGMIVGLSATIRGERMYDFFDRFVNIVLPRLRDFRGVSKNKFDKFGNYTIGLSDHTVFPEIDAAKAAPAHGFEITFVTDAKDRQKGQRLLELLGMPFTKD